MSGNIPSPRTRDKDGLDHRERAFLDSYIANGFNRSQAVRDAGYKTKDVSQKGAELLNRPHVIKALGKELQKRRNKFFVNEQDVLEGLYREATLSHTDGGTQQGRIQAWTNIGRALGMFDQKVKELQSKANPNSGTQITIVNYNSGTQQEKSVQDLQHEANEVLKNIPQQQQLIEHDNDGENDDDGE